MALPAVEKLPLPSKKSSADWSVGIKLLFVTDPHATFGAWQGCEVVGGGMNYDANDRSLEWFASYQFHKIVLQLIDALFVNKH
jgi:hypothetical protein